MVNNASTVTYGSSNTEIIAYILLMHGTDGRGSNTKQGTAGLACSTTTADKENCDDDKQFMDAPPNLAGGATYFDDIIRWVKKDDL
jgi:hypothetical protein